jgi:hypothetical protein
VTALDVKTKAAGISTHLRQAATSLMPIRPTDEFLSRGLPRIPEPRVPISPLRGGYDEPLEDPGANSLPRHGFGFTLKGRGE